MITVTRNEEAEGKAVWKICGMCCKEDKREGYNKNGEHTDGCTHLGSGYPGRIKAKAGLGKARKVETEGANFSRLGEANVDSAVEYC